MTDVLAADRASLPRPAESREGRFARPVTLHIVHDWGGGIEKWSRDFVAADATHWNLLLRSRSTRNVTGQRLELIDLVVGDEPLLAWDFTPPIGPTPVSLEAYREILDGVVAGFSVEAVVVSSLIGHSLEVLDTGLPTTVVLHDFYPFCPALFAWFGEACRTCDRSALQRCLESNPHNVFWHHPDAGRWEALREAYGTKLARPSVTVAAPSRGVHSRYAALFPALRDKPWRLIPHGLSGLPPRPPLDADFATLADGARRLRVLVPGRLSLHKGLNLLREALPRLSDFAEVLLLGSGEFGEPFENMEGVRVVPRYAQSEIAERVAEFQPDCALLLSVLPETFSYTLSEMQALAVPTVATRLGAFAERIEDGVNGFLVEPCAGQIVSRLRALAAEPVALAKVGEVLRATPVHSAAQMVADYRQMLDVRSGETATRGAGMLVTALAAAVEKSRERERSLSAERMRLVRGEVEMDSRIASLESDTAALHVRLAAAQAEIARLAQDLADAEVRRNALLGSTSWRLTRPLRALREAISGRVHMDASAAPAAASTAPATPETAPTEPASIRLIAFRGGDPVARGRAILLGGRLGLATAELREPLLPDPDLDGGVSLSLGMAATDAVGSAHLFVPGSICFDAAVVQAHRPADAVREHVAGRIVVPAQSIADALIEALGDDTPPTQVAVFPLVGGEVREELREAERSRRRDALGIPDRMRIVVGVGRGDACSGLLRFARVATEFAERANGCCFVWVGGRDRQWMREHPGEIGIPVALRRLFLVDDDAFESWLFAADAYLGCREDGVYDAGALEALAAGLPVAVECGSSLGDELRLPRFDGLLDLAVGENALPALAAWTRAPLVPRLTAAKLVREHFGSATAMAAFLAAFDEQRSVLADVATLESMESKGSKGRRR